MILYKRHLFDPSSESYEVLDSPVEISNPAVWRFRLEMDEFDFIKEVRAGEELVFQTTGDLRRQDLEFCLPAAEEADFLLKVKTQETDKVYKFHINPAYLPSMEMSDAFLDWAKPLHQYLVGRVGAGPVDIIEWIALGTTVPKETGTVKGEGISDREQREILSILDQIVQNPNRILINHDELVQTGQIDRINTSTVLYFIKHPETWRSRGRLHPSPIRVLAEKNKESLDVYENRFVLFFIKKAKKKLKRIVHRIEGQIKELNRQKTLMQAANHAGFRNRVIDCYWEIEQIDNRCKMLQNTFNNYISFAAALNRVRSDGCLREVRDSIKAKPHINQALAHDPRYARLMQIYKRLEMEDIKSIEVREIVQLTGAEICKYYQYYCFNEIMNILDNTQDMLFENQIKKWSEVDSENVFLKDIVVTYRHINLENCWINVKLFSNRVDKHFLRGSIEIEVTVGERKSRFTLIPTLICWDRVNEMEAEEGIEEIYQALSRFRTERQVMTNEEYLLDGVFLIHPTTLENIKWKDDYSSVRKVSNMGNNFLYEEDWMRYGGYRMGMFPIALPTETLALNGGKSVSHYRLKRLLRILLLETGALDYCWNCNSQNFNVIHGERGDEYTCLICGYRWGQNQCNGCRRILVKGITPGNHERSDEHKPEKLTLYLAQKELNEIEYATSATCEGTLFSPTWNICPYCGKCAHDENNLGCIRCKAKPVLNQKPNMNSAERIISKKNQKKF